MVAAVAARRSDLMATELGCAPAPAGAVAGLSAARGHRPSEVRSGTDFVTLMTRERATQNAQAATEPAVGIPISTVLGTTVAAPRVDLTAREAVPGFGQRGSTTRMNHLNEKLSTSRVASVLNCIEGKCGRARDGSETMCRGGCGRSLHMVSCAQVGSGFAALGNFTCVECRLIISEVEPAHASAENSEG